ncbi:hypothetical protein Hbal_0413 [Hirschia baltica ATCC 49814]|uniref:Flagellar basal-body/hook protein C-terminal domain-containing protein n=2 Tax=Hirschia TaxID=2723 RepID=C6XMH2_HIRBI|nr:hypothetical protein Hbal_0413 [Hirschia baltica ATCC 49814]
MVNAAFRIKVLLFLNPALNAMRDTYSMSAISSATSGVLHASQMFNRAATNTVKAANEQGDLVGAIVDQKQAEHALKANTAVLKVADDMQERLLDILV